MNRPPQAILFDIGSTLWSSPPEDEAALQRCYGRGREILLEVLPGVPPVEALIDAVEGYFAEWEENWRRDSSLVTQEPTTAFVATALGSLNIAPPPDQLQRFTDAILETSIYTAKVLEPEPDMVEALAALHGMGLRLGCVSNAFMTAATLDQIMTERGLGQYLELTVSSCELGYRKPHAAIYHAAIDKMSLDPAQTMFVGDRLDADVAGPAALGMSTALTLQYRTEDLSNATVQPDVVINHLRELAAFIRDASD